MNLIVFPTPKINTATAQSIMLFNSLKISTTTSPYLNQYTIPIAGHSINYILQDLSYAATLKAKLNNAKIWFIEQLFNSDFLALLIWHHLLQNTQKIPRRQKPKWYSSITQAIQKYIVNNNLNLQQPN